VCQNKILELRFCFNQNR